MTPKQLHILQHALGVDQYGQGWQCRSHFVTGPGSDYFNGCLKLVSQGLMVDRGPQHAMRNDHFFEVTDAGRVAMKNNCPAPPRLTASKKRYQQFQDADCGRSFREWLGIDRKARP